MDALVLQQKAKDLYVAVTKATLPDDKPPKEKHVRTLKIACSAHAPRPQVDFVIYKLGKRLGSPHWVIAGKALMVFHRLMRECDPSFLEQLLRYCDRTGRPRLLCLDRYADHSSREAWDYSAWVRAYGVYLDERLDAFRSMRFDPEAGNPARHQLAAFGYGGALGGPTGGPTGGFGGPTGGYGGPTGGYGGPTGGYGGPTGGYGGPTGGYGGPTGGYGGPTGGYGGGYGGPPGGYGGPTGGAGFANGGQQIQQQHPGQQGGPQLGQQLTGQSGQGQAQSGTSLKDCAASELLDLLPRMQRLMLRVLACVPEGAAAYNPICLTGAAWVLRESKAVYRAASEGVINLADSFFDMGRADAMRGLELYRDAIALHERLTSYYSTMQAVPALRTAINYPSLQPLPADFLQTMEKYAREAPREGAPAKSKVEPAPAAEEAPAPEEDPQPPPQPEPEPEPAPAPQEPEPVVSPVKAALAPVIDLLSFDDGPSEAVAAAAEAAPGVLDDLADGLTAPQGAQQQQGGAAAQGQAGQQPQGQYGGYPPQYTGYGGYPPQYTGYGGYGGYGGYAPQFTGYGGYGGYAAPTSMALVPVGPMGVNPFMPGGASASQQLQPYGSLAPFAAAAPAATGAAPANPNNPFANGGAGGGGGNGGGGAFVGKRLEGDPLNELTEQFLGPRPKPKTAEAVGARASLKDLKAAARAVVADSASSPRAAV
ncbi:hypothetical protein Rsub_08420 [Raphidocelis subcapitata]|uniref:ENTH domain-containing protein n=1 Tax=Raphidocelis subcapitata TaxID=307507 RepID=A0A2V0P6H3_9CHLO|nr:hypothetical protein Rsub_08420 [Raphidocelis subcapitata]|eukprot:GBF95458.1 hypothetical protein Rsub_08420 [Raphidocelis subcapitata]